MDVQGLGFRKSNGGSRRFQELISWRDYPTAKPSPVTKGKSKLMSAKGLRM